MANQRSGNILYVDSTGSADITSTVYVIGIVLTPTAAGGRIVLANRLSAGQTKIDLRAATSGESKDLDLTTRPMIFEDGINVSTLSNAVATIFTSTTGKAG